MATTRRVGTEKSKTRAVLLNSAAQLMLEQGYASVSYRTLAAKAGVTAGLVQYYFPTFDDLFVALVRDRSERNLKKLEKGLQGERPLHAVWEYANNKDAAALTAELTAAANHRKRLRAELAQAGEQARALALAAVERTAGRQELLGQEVSADVMVFLVTSLPRMVIMEQSTGMTTSHAEMMAFLEEFLERVEPAASADGVEAE